MGRLAQMFKEAIHIRTEHWRPCKPCRATGWKPQPLRAPDGKVPVRAIIAKIQCDECGGRGKRLVGEQVTEKGLTRAWENGLFIGSKRR